LALFGSGLFRAGFTGWLVFPRASSAAALASSALGVVGASCFGCFLGHFSEFQAAPFDCYKFIFCTGFLEFLIVEQAVCCREWSVVFGDFLSDPDGPLFRHAPSARAPASVSLSWSEISRTSFSGGFDSRRERICSISRKASTASEVVLAASFLWSCFPVFFPTSATLEAPFSAFFTSSLLLSSGGFFLRLVSAAGEALSVEHAAPMPEDMSFFFFFVRSPLRAFSEFDSTSSFVLQSSSSIFSQRTAPHP
jgi:hypothetical protein